jgi:hypothetical protein
VMVPNARWQFVLVENAPEAWRARAQEDVTAAVMDQAVRVGDEAGLPLHHYALEQAAEAHAAVENGAVGKGTDRRLPLAEHRTTRSGGRITGAASACRPRRTRVQEVWSVQYGPGS